MYTLHWGVGGGACQTWIIYTYVCDHKSMSCIIRLLYNPSLSNTLGVGDWNHKQGQDVLGVQRPTHKLFEGF